MRFVGRNPIQLPGNGVPAELGEYVPQAVVVAGDKARAALPSGPDWQCCGPF